jgi:SAM-dependent methyltransferase
MIQLCDLVFLKNALESAIDLSGIKKEIEDNQNKLINIIPHAYHYSEKVSQLSNNHGNLFNTFQSTVEELKSTLNDINIEIENLTKKFFEDNYQTECLLNDPKIIRRDKVMFMADGSADILLNRIHLYSTWKYPALEIGCRDGEWTKHLITFDPLYVADNHKEFIDNAISQFTPEYQKRVRRYYIQDFKIHSLNQFDQIDKPTLPLNQFGFIFSYNYFNYLSLDSIKQLLSQAMEWLKPGGTMLFTYNNADMSGSAGLTEGYFMTYVPKSMLLPMAESLGFDVVQCFDFQPSTSWVELRKPGVLTTVKAHQALGEIKFK